MYIKYFCNIYSHAATLVKCNIFSKRFHIGNPCRRQIEQIEETAVEHDESRINVGMNERKKLKQEM